jgi:hypothetical protein
LLHPQPDQTERRPLVKDDEQDHAAADDGDVQALGLAFVEQRGKFVFADDLSNALGGRHVAGRQGGERSRINFVQIASRGDLLP